MSFSDNFQVFEREKMIRNGVSENGTRDQLNSCVKRAYLSKVSGS